MLKKLQVKNFAIIDDATIKFRKGLNVLTGETGAGKTLIIEAINLLIGDRADIDLIRDGEEKLMVQGYFNFTGNPAAINFLLSEKLIEDITECDDVIITRELNKNGRNRAFINGIFTRVSNLKRLGELFLDIHGQHDHQYLLDRKTHLETIDRFGAGKINEVKKEYLMRLKIYKQKAEELSELRELKNSREEKLKELNYRYEEIVKLDIKKNEENELENEIRILKNYEKIYRLATEIKKIIDGDKTDMPPLEENLAVISNNIKELSKIDNKFENLGENLSSLSETIADIGHYTGSYLADFDFSTQKLDSIQERLFRLSQIKKKYNMDLNSINEYAEKIKNEIDTFENLDSEINKKQSGYNEAKNSLIEIAFKLSELRKEVIKDFQEKVTSEMTELGFKSVSFLPEHRIVEGEDGVEAGDKKIKFGKNGIDDIEFLISLNVGESERPLGKIASGGEISRIMLALKSVISSIDKINTMIFDEIDAGIGGTISLVVGEKLFKISKSCQVIVITHLAQIACFSDIHYFIDKFIENNRTRIKIKKLGSTDKIQEISRMLSGLAKSDIAVMHAEELMEKCNSIKNDLMERKIKVEN